MAYEYTSPTDWRIGGSGAEDFGTNIKRLESEISAPPQPNAQEIRAGIAAGTAVTASVVAPLNATGYPDSDDSFFVSDRDRERRVL